MPALSGRRRGCGVLVVLLAAAVWGVAPGQAFAVGPAAGMGVVPGEPEPNPAPGPAPSAPEAEGEPPEPSLTRSPGPSPRQPSSPDGPREEPEPAAEPEPSPGPSPPAQEVIDGLPEEAGWGSPWDFFDLPGAIADALTGFIGELIETALEPFLGLLGATLLATPAVTDNPTLSAMWTGSLKIALVAYVVLVIAGGVTLMGYETVQSRYAFKHIAPRAVIGVVAAAFSLLVVARAVDLSNALSTAIVEGAELEATGKGMAEMLLGGALTGGSPVHLMVLGLVLVVMVAAVLVGYLARVAVVALLAVCGPLALSCHGLPQTEGIARLWWRALGGCVAIQVCQSTALAVALRLFFAPGNTLLGLPDPGQLETLLAGVCVFWVLWKIPGWTVQVILRGSPATMPHAPAPVRMLRGVALAMLLHRHLPLGGRTAAARTAPAVPGRSVNVSPPPAGAVLAVGPPPVASPSPGLAPAASAGDSPSASSPAAEKPFASPLAAAGQPPDPPAFFPPTPEPPPLPPTRAGARPPAPVFRSPAGERRAPAPEPTGAPDRPVPTPAFRAPRPEQHPPPRLPEGPSASVPTAPRFQPPATPPPPVPPVRAGQAPPMPFFRPPAAMPPPPPATPRASSPAPPPPPLFRAPELRPPAAPPQKGEEE